MNKTTLDSGFDQLDEFKFKDVYHAINKFKAIRVKNKIPSHVFEGQTGLLITVSITKHKNIHVERRMK